MLMSMIGALRQKFKPGGFPSGFFYAQYLDFPENDLGGASRFFGGKFLCEGTKTPIFRYVGRCLGGCFLRGLL